MVMWIVGPHPYHFSPAMMDALIPCTTTLDNLGRCIGKGDGLAMWVGVCKLGRVVVVSGIDAVYSEKAGDLLSILI